MMITVVGTLAMKLHERKSDELSCDLPTQLPKTSTADYEVDGKALRFTSLEGRNGSIATHVFELNKAAFADEPYKWLHAAHDIWRFEIGKPDSAAGRLLARVHHTDDIFSIAAYAIENNLVEVFNALHVIEAALPYLDEVEVGSIFKLCAAQNEGTKYDLFAGMIFGEIEKYFLRHPGAAHSTYQFFTNNVCEETANLYPVALVALAKSSPVDAVKFALADVQSPKTTLKRIAIWTLGLLLASSLVPADSTSKVSSAIIDHMEDPMEQVRQSAMRAAAQAMPVTDAFNTRLILLAEAGDQYALGSISNALITNHQAMSQKDGFNAWIHLVRKVSPNSKGVLDNFDYVLAQMMAAPDSQQLAIDCLTEWAEENAKGLPKGRSVAELFDGAVSKIANRPDLLSQVITDWFLSDSRQLAAAAAGLLSYLWVRKFRALKFSASRLDKLEQSDLILLVRRMLGFVSNEEHLLSLTMSLLNTKEAAQRTYSIVHSLLVDELGKDYPSSTVEILEAAKGATTDAGLLALYSSSAKAVIDRVNQLDSLPRLPELRPPPGLQRQLSKVQAKKMEAASDDAKKHSIMRQIATEIPIKAGVGSFSFREGGFTEATHFHSFSTSVSLPRRYVIDAVGYEINGMMFRLAHRGQS